MAGPQIQEALLSYIPLTNFNDGEWSPLMEGRIDLPEYQSSCRKRFNMLGLPQGGATRRSGTAHVWRANIGGSNYTDAARILPFIADEDTCFAMLMLSGVIGFVNQDGPVLSGGSFYTLASPYSLDQMKTLSYAQSNDVVFLAQQANPPYTLRYSGGLTNWAIDSTTYLTQNGPFLDINPTLASANPNAWKITGTGSTVTVLADATTAINDDSGFLAQDVGRVVRFFMPDLTIPANQADTIESYWYWGTIASVISTTSVTVDLEQPLRNVNLSGERTAQWMMGAWSAYTGYPGIVAFFAGRIFYANTPYQPSTIFGSGTGNYVDQGPTKADGTVTDATALNLTFADGQDNPIRWICPAGSAQSAQLGIGTMGGEQILQAASLGSALSSNNLQGYLETNYGSDRSNPPIRVGKSLLFSDGRHLREWTFSWQVNGYNGPDLLVKADHLSRSGIARTWFQKRPIPTFWACMNDGSLASMTYLRDQNVVGWSSHRLGGSYHGGPPRVVGGCALPNPQLLADDVYLLVLRTIAGGDVLDVEAMQQPFRDQAVEAGWFCDSGLTTALQYPGGSLLIDYNVIDTATGDDPPSWGGPVIGGDGDLVPQTITFHLSTAFSTRAGAPGAGVPAPRPGGTIAPSITTPIAVGIGDMIRCNGGVAEVVAIIDNHYLHATVLIPFTHTGTVAEGEWSLTPRYSEFTGFDHLDGETVCVLADGRDLGDFTIMGGRLTIPAPGASLVTAGLNYASALAPQKIETGIGPIQTALGKIKRIHRLYVRMFQTVGGSYGPSAQIQDRFPVRDGYSAAPDLLPLLANDNRRPMPGGNDSGGTIYLRQDRPLPMTVLALVAACEVAS